MYNEGLFKHKHGYTFACLWVSIFAMTFQNHCLAFARGLADDLVFSSMENWILSLPACFESSPTLLLPAATFLGPFLITPGKGNGLEEAIMATSSCNILKDLWTISVTSWFFLPYWLAHRCRSFPLLLCPLLSLFLNLIPLSYHSHLALKLDHFCTLPQSPSINVVKKIKPNTNSCFISLLWPKFCPFPNAFCDILDQFFIHWLTSHPNLLTDLRSNLSCVTRWKRFLEGQMSCTQAFPQPVFCGFA